MYDSITEYDGDYLIRRILKDLLAGALRQQAILEAEREGLQLEVLRSEFMASSEPSLLLAPARACISSTSTTRTGWRR